MKVVHFSSSDNGGAGKAALRLHKGLLQNGIDSTLLVIHKTTEEKGVVQYKRSLLSKVITHSGIPYRQNKYNRFIKLHSCDYECLSFPEAIYDISDSRLIQEADVINLHWVGSCLNYKSFFRNIKQPVVWTLHDKNPFLGIAHLMGDKEKNTEHFELEEKIRLLKRDAIHQNKNLTIVTLCDWMKRSSILSETFSPYKHCIIPNSLDTNIFKFRDKQDVRREFGLNTDKPLLMFASQYVKSFNKGIDILFEAISTNNFDCEFIIIGQGEPKGINAKTHYLGSIQDEEKLAKLYAAADAFILPSREDNLPNTMLESLCCGTPVISMPNGGMAENIQDGVNGYISKTIDAKGLGDAITAFIDNKDRFNNKKIAVNAHKKFAPDVQAKKYIELYTSLMN